MSPAENLLNEIAMGIGAPGPIDRVMEELLAVGVSTGVISANPPPIFDPETNTITAVLLGSIHEVQIDGVLTIDGDAETVMIGDQWYWIDRHMDGAEIGPYPDQAQARAALAADERRRALAEALKDL